MCKHLTTFFLSNVLLACGLLIASIAFAEEDIEYRFERFWPQLEQPWFFNNPSALAIAPNGSVYIADTGNHRIQQFSAEGDFIRRWGRLGSKPGQFDHPAGIAIAPNGSIYVSDTSNGRIQQFSAKGNYIRQWKMGESGDLDSPLGIAIAPDSSVYVTEPTQNRIQQFTPKGNFIRAWGSLEQFNHPSGLAISADGSVYVADRGNHRIQQFSAQGDFIRAWGSKGADDGQFDRPSGLAIASDGSLYISDFANSRIQQFSATGGFIRTWGHQGIGDRQFYEPNGLAVAADGSVYVTEIGNPRIQQFNAQGDFIKTWESFGSTNGHFLRPEGISLASDGGFYIADTTNHRIQQFNSAGDFVRAWGQKGSGDGQFLFPGGIAVAPDASVFVADTSNHRIQQFSSEGAFIRAWGSKGSGNRQFNHPKGLAIATDGNLYIADTENHRIQKFSASGEFIYTQGSQGTEDGQFFLPEALAINSDSSVYVTDTRNHRIQQFSAEGDFIRAWGSRGAKDGQFFLPKSIAIAPDGSVYIADTDNNRLQQFSAEGKYLRTFGDQGVGIGQFDHPEGIAIDTNGSIYIVDTRNHRIQKFAARNKTNISSSVEGGKTITHPYKAVILAGGGETIGGLTNHIWDGTWRITQKAYKALSRQAFIVHDEIKFITAGSTEFDLDNNELFDDLELATKDSLHRAITEWATDAKDVVIFMADHGGPGKFQINNTEILTAEELNSWVSQLDDTIPGTVTVIIEACNSASFFDPLSKPERNLFASAKAEQPAVISNDGLSSFSYFFWSEISSGALLKNAFSDARQAMSQVIIDGLAQDAQADTNGDQQFTQLDLDSLGDYCLGNCNQTAAAAPVITPVKPSSQSINGETALDFSITVNHLQALNRVWALVQRPDDISIDPNQPLNFEKIMLSCNSEDICQGRYEHFDLAGEYQISFYAMDVLEEVSFPETLTITQTQGKAVSPAIYDEQLAVVYLRDVLVDGQHLQAALEFQGDKFVVIAFSAALKEYTPAAEFDIKSGLLKVPYALAFGSDYQATFKYLGNLEFELQSASPK